GLRYNGEAIVLDDHLLIEEDAPGLGALQSALWETIEKGIILRKHLTIDHWPVREAILTMMIYPSEPAEPYRGAAIAVRVNRNHPNVHAPGHVWTSIPIPVDFLKEGENVIELTVRDPGVRFRTPITLHSTSHRRGAAGRYAQPI